MNKNPRVSVLMPVYNGERYVRKAVESILNQTFTDFEFIIVDDGSTDNTPALLKQYKDARLRVIRQENRGLAASLQRGLELARGEFFARQDADDVSLPERLEKQVDYLERNPQVGVVGTGVMDIDEEDQPLHTKKLPCSDPEARVRLAKASPVCHGSIMARMDLLRRSGGYRVQFPDCEDRDLWLRVAECADITNMSQVLYLWRLHAGSVSATRRERQMQSGDFAVEMAVKRLIDGTDLFGHPYGSDGETGSPIYAKQRMCLGAGLLRTGHFAIGLRLILGALARYPVERVFWRFLLPQLPKFVLVGAVERWENSLA